MDTTGPEFEFFRSLPMFSSQSEQSLRRLTRGMQKKKYPQGSYFFFQDEPVEKLYILEMGVVEIYKSDENGKKLALWHIESGNAFCLANIFAGRAFANARAVSDCLAFYIGRDKLEEILAQDPKLSRQFIQCLSSKLAAYSMLLEDFTFKNVQARLAKLLLRFVGKDGATSPQACDLSRNEIAALLGTCREVVSRTLGRLKQDGLISMKAVGKKQHIYILDAEQLKNIGNEQK